MIRLLDQVVSGMLLVTAAALLGLWFRSHTTGDRYRWEEVIETDTGGLIIHAGAVWTGEGGIAFSADRRATEDERAVQRIRLRMLRNRWIPVGYSSIDDPRYPMRGGSTGGPLAPLGIYAIIDDQPFGPIEQSVFAFTVPIWLLLVVVAGYPVGRYFLGVVRREREERRHLGLCPRCGFDVRPMPNQCPACGKHEPLLPAGASRRTTPTASALAGRTA